MRNQLRVTSAAVALMIVLAFVVPLGLLVRTFASDRALRSAEQRAAALVSVLSTVSEPGDVARVVDGLNTGDPAFVTVVHHDGSVTGAPLPPGTELDLALARSQRSFSIDENGGTALYLPVVRADGSVEVIRTFVPDAVLTRGVATSWALLGALGLTLVLAATALADRLARSVVGPVGELAATAERLGRGDMAARVEPDGPPEIVEVGETLNRLAGRIDGLLVAEREAVADLSHRLRTPITALKLDAEAVGDPADRARLMGDVDALQEAVTTLINDARRTSRRPAGPSLPSDLVAVTRERVSFWAALAEDQDRAFTVELPDAALPVAVGRDDLCAALDVLLGNVLAHTPEGAAFRVAVAAVDGDGFRGGELIVDDAGPGGPAPLTVERGRSGGGSTGLGLDIVRQTAAGAGGTMATGAAPLGGTRVRVRLASPPASVSRGSAERGSSRVPPDG